MSANAGMTIGELLRQVRETPLPAGRRPLSIEDPGVLEALAQGIVPFIKQRIADAVTPLITRIAELEAEVAKNVECRGIWEPQIAALKAELAKKSEYRRIWDAQGVYKLNDEVTFKGQRWICEAPNSNSRPGTNSDWRLTHKRENL
jgi:hypothetical protein